MFNKDVYRPLVARISQHALVPGGIPAEGVYLVWGCTWSWGVYLVLGGVPGPGVPGPRGCTWSVGGVPGPGQGGTWSGEVYLVLGGCTCLVGVYLVPGGMYLLGGVPCPRGCVWSQGEGVYLVLGGTCPGTPPMNRMTNRCKNITLPQTLFADSNKST